jgi:ADP-ribosylglycohydrolase
MMSEETTTNTRLEDRIYGCLLGGMIGDAMGAPGEGKTFLQIQEQYGPEGITSFQGVGTDDTAIREQLIDSILRTEGFVTCDAFAESFQRFRQANYGQWWVPVRNAFHKFDSKVTLPIDSGWGNAPSSSSAMAISPLGILNAANPRQAALETFGVASFLHSGPSGFCRDAACAMAAAIAEAFHPQATVATIVEAAIKYLPPVSAQEIIRCVDATRRMAQENGLYETFRGRFYATSLREEQCDSRETVPVALALFEMMEGDPELAILRAANFGRDADTIATMVGGLCGALRGASDLPQRWQEQVLPEVQARYRQFAAQLAGLVLRRAEAGARYASTIAMLG